MTKLTVPACELCNSVGGFVLWQDSFCRVVEVSEPDYPGFCRVILDSHVKEMSDLAPGDRARLLNAVNETETALRTVLRPDKINIASLGNATPHLHWHVIPRFRDDRHFPGSVWSVVQRPPAGVRRVDIAVMRTELAGELNRRMGGC